MRRGGVQTGVCGGDESEWSLDLAGTSIEPVFQQYVCSREPSLMRGELLSRPQGVTRIEEFFGSLTYEDNLAIFRWQLEVKEEFSARTGLRVSINVDNGLLDTEEQRAAFLDVIALFPTPATFEFTETHPMPPVDQSNRLLRAVRDLGHVSALDDFGTGLNGMSLLTDYDFDVIKIDRMLTVDIGERVEKRSTVALILQMLDVLGKRHVVEGIDDAEVYRMLCDAGFTTYQGFLFHRPQPLDEVTERLAPSKEVS